MRIILTLVFVLGVFFAGCTEKPSDTVDKRETAVTGGGSQSSANPDSSSKAIDVDSESDDKPKTESAEKDSGITAVYTDLAENKCKTVDINEQEEWSVQSCDGVEGYSLNVSEGDLRQTIDVISPNGKKHNLEMWTVVSSGFSTVGDKAEWRIKKTGKKKVPIALIVRYNVNEDPENTEKIRSYLTVSKITPEIVCITDIVKPTKYANNKARQLADRSTDKPCLKK